ncbi:MAG: hypothetical protein ABFS43_06140 [Thermodesulfobacteriota bacterium]
MNHENTKSKKHEIFGIIFRGFLLSFFRDEENEHRTSNVQHRILNALLIANMRPETCNPTPETRIDES